MPPSGNKTRSIRLFFPVDLVEEGKGSKTDPLALLAAYTLGPLLKDGWSQTFYLKRPSGASTPTQLTRGHLTGLRNSS